MQFVYNRRVSQNIVATPMRFFGGHGPHYHRKKFVSKETGVEYQIPEEKGDFDTHFTDKWTPINRFFTKIAAKTRLHREDIDNARPVKNSGYYWFPRVALFRNSAFLKLMGYMFDSNKIRATNVYDEPVQIHENSVFLYKSPNSSSFLTFRMYDYFGLSCVLLGLFHPYPLLWLPAITYFAEFPKIYNTTKYYTIRADLLPHTEQVVFTKGLLFGSTTQHVVNIKDLQKVPASDLPGGDHLFSSNRYDPDFVWKDNLTSEFYVFASNGVWNEEGINHPLLN
jgi:hypothetical protein